MRGLGKFHGVWRCIVPLMFDILHMWHPIVWVVGSLGGGTSLLGEVASSPCDLFNLDPQISPLTLTSSQVVDPPPLSHFSI